MKPEEHYEETQMITVTVTDDDGKTEDRDFRLIAIYTLGKQQYIALTPDLDSPDLEADIYLYRYAEEGEQCTVEEIIEDEEFAAAAEAFQQWQINQAK